MVDGAVDTVQLCVRDIRIWMSHHFLELNDAKSEVLVVGSRQQLAKAKVTGVTFGNTMVTPSARLRDLGIVFDTEMTMVDHVNTVSRAAGHAPYEDDGPDMPFPLPGDLQTDCACIGDFTVGLLQVSSGWPVAVISG